MATATDAKEARALDAADELAPLRDAFVVDDADLVYLDGNSLGRLPKGTVAVVERAVQEEWGSRLIRSWNEGWIAAPLALGAEIAPLIGAEPDEVIVAETTSVNLFKLAAAALMARPERYRIISDTLNFPSDLYVVQGLVELLGRRHELVLVPSRDGVQVEEEDLEAEIDAATALVCLSHVSFKSGFLYDMAAVTAAAHQQGALVLWDLSHSVGAVPIDLRGAGVDLAIGCTYKYLNGGPGAPAFLYVRRELQRQLSQPIWGWFGAETPFAFDLEFAPARDLRRFWVSTPPVLSMRALEVALAVVREAGIDRLRDKSVRQTEYLISLAEQWLLPLGFELGSPRQPSRRGSHVSVLHDEAWRISRALIEPERGSLRVIPDFRAPRSLRLGLAPLYTTYSEIHRAMVRLRRLVESREYRRFSRQPTPVT